MSARLGRLGRMLLALVFAIAGLAGITATATPASAAGTASISGTMTAGGPEDLVSPLITVRRLLDDGTWVVAESDFWPEGPSVSYSYTGLEAGTYRVEFYDYENYASEYWNGQYHADQAELITLADGDVRTGIDATLEYNVSLSGRLTDPNGDPVPDFIGVNAFIENPVTGEWESVAGNTTSGGNGEYEITRMQPGNYKVQFDPGIGHPELASEYYNDKADLDSADILTLAPGDSETADGQLAATPPPVGVSGTLTDETTGDPIVGKCVIAYAYDAGTETSTYAQAGCTDSLGAYTIDLNPGAYKVGVGFSAEYVAEWYDDVRDEVDADVLDVTSAGMSGIDIALTPAGKVTGQVTDEATGDPLSYVYVVAAMQGTGNESVYGNAYTDGDGNYEVIGLAPGDYKISYDGSDYGYAWEYFDDAFHEEIADVVPVTSGESSTADEDLSYPGTISGTVTDGSLPVEGILVEAYELEDGSWVKDPEHQGDYTDSFGEYDIADLHPGTFRIKFDGDFAGYESEFYEDVATVDLADNVVLPAGETVTVDGEVAELGGGTGSIAGTVTSSASGTPALQDVCVRAWFYDDDLEEWDWNRQDCTDAGGAYNITGLDPDDYKLQFVADDGNHNTEWYDNKPSRAEADDVTVALGAAVTGKNAQLAAAGHIAGTVTNFSSAGIQNVQVTAYRLDDGDWVDVGDASTASNGDYDIGGLDTGTYRIGFEGVGQYIGEFYDNASTVETGTNISVTAGATTGDRDAQLDIGATITGTLTGPSGPIGGGVYAYLLDNGSYVYENFAVAGSNGEFSMPGLPAGTYKLRYVSSPLATEWWDNAPSEATATPISVQAGQTYTKSAQLSAGSKVTGTVTNAGGTAISGASVSLYQRTGQFWTYVKAATTNSSGGFELAGLQPSTYTLAYSATSYAPEYWDDKLDLEDADGFLVGDSVTVAGKNASLQSAGHITGTVTGAGAGGLTGVDVYAYQLVNGEWSYRNDAQTGAGGTYDVGSLPAGTYRLQFYGATGYADEYWNDKPTIDEADNIAVTAGGTASGKNAELAQAGQVSGTVTAPGGAGIEDLYVEAYLLEGGDYEYVDDSYTDEDGDYVIDGLLPGTYKIRFSGQDEFIGEWYNNKPSEAAADPITVTAGMNSTGISAELAIGANVTGTVTGTGGAPLDGVGVTAYRLVDGDLDEVGYAQTENDGTYTVQGLTAGDYKLQFYDGGSLTNAYAPEWWNDALTPGTATAFAVAATGTVTGKNAALVPGSHLAGKVTGPTGTALSDVEVTVSRFVDGAYEQENFTFTNGTGDFDIDGLPAGTYKVEFDDGPGGQPTEYWDNTTTFAAATPITVGASTTVGSINAQLGSATPPGTVVAGTPTITGTPQVGSQLVANPGTWTPGDVTFAYQWLANDVAISGATIATFTPTSAQANATIKVRVTGSKPTFTPATATSAGVGPVTTPSGPSTVTNTGLPTIGGTAKVGLTLTASGGSWNPGDVTLAYQWLSNGSPIAGATGTSYAVKPGDVGKQLSVRVTASKSGFTSATASSGATGAVATGTILAAKKPSLTGKAKAGKTLTLKTGSYEPDGKVKIAWFLNGKKISGQKGTKLAVKAAYVGKTITAEVTVTSPGYAKLELETKGKKVT